MVARVLEQEPAIRQVLGSDRKTAHLIPTWQDVEVLESVNKALSPLADLTDIISGENYVTTSTLKPLLNHITSEALSVEANDTQLLGKYSEPGVNELLDLASFVDPRFKVEYVNATDVEGVKARVVEEALDEAIACGLLQQQLQEESAQEAQSASSKKKKAFKPA